MHLPHSRLAHSTLLHRSKMWFVWIRRISPPEVYIIENLSSQIVSISWRCRYPKGAAVFYSEHTLFTAQDI